MVKRVLIFFIWLIHSNIASSQTREHVNFIYTVKKKGYLYIPPKVLTDSAAVIISKYLPKDTATLYFVWTAGCGDGTSYYLTITPQQIYLTTGHNNPNPNFLYFLSPINSAQYQQIRNGSRKSLQGFSREKKYHKWYYYDKVFVDSSSKIQEISDDELNQYYAYCKRQMKNQLVKYFTMLNSYIRRDTKKLLLPEYELTRPKYISENKQEIIDWLPHKRKIIPPKEY